MGLVADVAIVTQAQVEAITHEDNLTNLDADASATLANLLPEATNAIIREVKKRQVDPAIITNIQDLRAAASYWVMWTIYSSRPQVDDEIIRKTDLYEKKWKAEITSVVLETSSAESIIAPRGLPKTVNLDAVPFISVGLDNRKQPSDGNGPFYSTK